MYKYIILYSKFRMIVYAFLIKLPMGNYIIRQLRKLTQYLALAVLPNPVLANGYKLYWHKNIYADAIVYSTGKYDEDTCHLLQNLTCPGMIALDIGAHLGYFTLLLADIVGNKGKVYSFEPQPLNCDAIRKSAKANGFNNITVIPKAVSNKSEMLDLYFINEGDGIASIYKGAESRGQQHLTVESIALDTFFEKEGWLPIDIIKMDIEGAEIAALEGARELFRRNPQVKLIIEFYPELQKNAGGSPEDFFGILTGLGFNRFSIVKNNLYQITIPDDIARVVLMTADPKINMVNIYCSRV
jgi:FkbM family methyltransferase